jgi:SSS family solute:Na+ symporter
MDFYSRLHPGVSQERLVWIGRVATAVMVVVGLAWIPVIRGGKGLYDYLQGVSAYIGTPIFVVFFFGVFFKRMNARGALAALITGFTLGLFRLVVDTLVKMIDGFSYTEGSLLWVVNNIYFQYYSLGIFAVSALVMVAVSRATAPPGYEKLQGLTYGTLTAEDRRASRASWSTGDVVASAVVLLLILGVYLAFTG